MSGAYIPKDPRDRARLTRWSYARMRARVLSIQRRAGNPASDTTTTNEKGGNPPVSQVQVKDGCPVTVPANGSVTWFLNAMLDANNNWQIEIYRCEQTRAHSFGDMRWVADVGGNADQADCRYTPNGLGSWVNINVLGDPSTCSVENLLCCGTGSTATPTWTPTATATPSWTPTPIATPAPVVIGDRVWYDLNADGIQDAGEPGAPGVTVRLLDTAGNVLATTITDANGNYEFGGLAPGDYRIEVSLPAGYVFAPADQGSDDAANGDGCQLQVTVSGDTDVLQAWLDFRNGLELVMLRDTTGVPISGGVLTAGTHVVTCDILIGTFNGGTNRNIYGRFRLSSADGLRLTGPAPDGEVEDYLFSFGPNSVTVTDFRLRMHV